MTEDTVWEYAEDLRRFASYLCHDIQDAEDVAQNALLKAAQSRDGAFRAEASVRTWLHTIATNECRMLHRHQAPDSLDRLLTDHPALATLDPSVHGSPEEAAVAAESRRAVLATLRQLPAPYQRVLLLKDGCGMRTAEVAKILNASLGATKSRLYRARKSLRDELVLADSVGDQGVR